MTNIEQAFINGFLKAAGMTPPLSNNLVGAAEADKYNAGWGTNLTGTMTKGMGPYTNLGNTNASPNIINKPIINTAPRPANIKPITKLSTQVVEVPQHPVFPKQPVPSHGPLSVFGSWGAPMANWLKNYTSPSPTAPTTPTAPAPAQTPMSFSQAYHQQGAQPITGY